MEIFRLFGSILINDDEARQNIQSVDRQAQKSSGNMAGAFKKLAGILATVFAVDKLKDFGTSAIEAAANAQAMGAQFEQVFGDVGKSAQATIDKLGKDFGMVPTRIKPAMTQMTSMFKGLGMETEEAMTTAKDAVTLVADAAAFYDKSFEDANASLNSFIKGNYEGGESIGLFANETQMAAWAAKNLKVDWKKLDEAGKQVTRLEFAKAMQEAAGATGQAARESDSYQNQLGNLKQTWEDLKAKLAAPILNPVIKGLKRLAGMVQSVDVEKIHKGFKVVGDYVKKVFGPAFDVATSAVRFLIDGLKAVYDMMFGSGDMTWFIDNFGLDKATQINNFLWDMADAFQAVKDKAKKVVDAIGIVYKAFMSVWYDTGEVPDLLAKLGIRPEKAKIIEDVFKQIIDATKNAFGFVRDIVSNVGTFLVDIFNKVKDLFQGNHAWSESFIRVFKVIKSVALPILQDAVKFIKGKFAEIKKFWDENGAQIIEAIKNVWTIIAGIFKFIAPVILFIVKMLWTNVKGVISGALDIIMGIIKVFAGLFTGDFGKMWEGIKELFFGAVEFIWNLVNLMMFGKLISGIKVFAAKGVTAFKEFWTKAVEVFKNLDTHVWNIITGFVSKIVGVLKGFVDEGVRVFGTLRTFGANIFQSLWAAIKTVVSEMAGSVVGFFRNMFTGAKFQFDGLLSAAKNIFGAIKNAITNPIDTAVGVVKSAIDKIKGFFSSLKVKIPLPHFNVSTKNKNIAGINVPIPNIDVDWYAKGTNFAPGGLAVVGEQGPELVNLPRGSKVHTANETKDMLNNEGIRYLTIEAPVVIDGQEVGLAIFPTIDLMQAVNFTSSMRLSGVKG